MENYTYLVTGALGFIGSNFVNYMAAKYIDATFIVLDKKTYCSSEENITPRENITVIIGSIQNNEIVTYILNKFGVTHIVNFAAETHVDNSFYDSIRFTENNVVGVHHLLESARIYGKLTMFIHVSTDEVYGEVVAGARVENSTLDPTNPYSATKAAAEFIAKSYHYSYKMPIVITRANNVYGQNQYPEKIIPLFICKMLDGEPLTIHGDGSAKRTFIHVDDVSRAYEVIIQKGSIGEVYNIGTDDEYSVLDIAHMISDRTLYVEDRVFNDCRYSINKSKMSALGWECKMGPLEKNIPGMIEC